MRDTETMTRDTTETVRILVVDDHPIVRFGIRQMLDADPSLSICGEADSGHAALQRIESSHVDLAIVDLSLRDGSGLELIRAMRELDPALRILVLSMHDEALFAERALKAGAHGYVMKQESVTDLVRAIQEIRAGRVYVSDSMARSLSKRPGDDASHGGRLESLTDREFEVFELIGRGLSTAAIADRLRVSIKTIETYRSNLKAKLDLKDAADLIRYAATWTERR
jgi:DNA-binding NarL/FixJ family response regulator